MNVLVIGAGALGLAIGASLVGQNIDVDFIARNNTYKAIKEKGIKRDGLFGEINVNPNEFGVYESYQELEKDKYDIVIVSSKTTANADISKSLSEVSDVLKDSCKIVLMQNGYGYEEPFLKYFDKMNIYHSRVITGLMRSELNISTVTAHQAPILIGSLFGADLNPVKPIAEAINNSGIESQVEKDIEKAIWAKLIYNTTLNPLGAILGLSYGELAESEFSVEIMNNLIEETFEVMKLENKETYWEDAESYKNALYNEMLPQTGKHRSSTLQDIEKKQKTEIDTLNGSVLKMAEKHGVELKAHKYIYCIIKAMEGRF